MRSSTEKLLRVVRWPVNALRRKLARCQQGLWKSTYWNPPITNPGFRESTICNLLVCKAFIITTRSFLLKNKSKHSNKKSISCRCSIDYFGLRSVRSHSSPCFQQCFFLFFFFARLGWSTLRKCWTNICNRSEINRLFIVDDAARMLYSCGLFNTEWNSPHALSLA